MGIIAKLFGKQSLDDQAGSSFKTIAAVEKALQTLSGDRREAQEAIAAKLAKRRELLLVDDSDQRIAALDAECDAKRLVLERCDVIQPHLMARLAELQDERRREQWRDISRRHSDAVDNFIAKTKEALTFRRAMTLIVEEAERAQFRAEARTLIEPLGFLTDEALENFIYQREKFHLHDATITKPAAVKVPASPPIIEK